MTSTNRKIIIYLLLISQFMAFSGISIFHHNCKSNQLYSTSVLPSISISDCCAPSDSCSKSTDDGDKKSGNCCSTKITFLKNSSDLSHFAYSIELPAIPDFYIPTVYSPEWEDITALYEAKSIAYKCYAKPPPETGAEKIFRLEKMRC